MQIGGAPPELHESGRVEGVHGVEASPGADVVGLKARVEVGGVADGAARFFTQKQLASSPRRFGELAVLQERTGDIGIGQGDGA